MFCLTAFRPLNEMELVEALDASANAAPHKSRRPTPSGVFIEPVTCDKLIEKGVKTSYELRYFNINNEEEDDDDDKE
ncbi:hypothetical protein OUZ56_028748 [Daphnia magna]|uniref:Uncharacterized protein n=1 Tax=Daphnia magna TaxID=35525 RepID=A0ABR0B5C9_9CRUS|nr:hypothetical protein OUZ56_028748 [Daphnia magna]